MRLGRKAAALVVSSASSSKLFSTAARRMPASTKAVKDMPARPSGHRTRRPAILRVAIARALRIAQRDILDFSRNHDGSYRELKWPDEYWPKKPEPPNADAWQKSVEQIRADRKASSVFWTRPTTKTSSLPFPWGNGQNLLREAFLIADHEAYHVGELVLLRRLLGAWKR